MLKRYIGPFSPVTVVIAGQDFGMVETGDSLAVPDDLANSVAWPETNWADDAPAQENSAAEESDN